MPKIGRLTNAFRTAFTTLTCQPPYQNSMHNRTLNEVEIKRNELMQVLLNILTIIAFGAEVPVLLVLAPLFSWLNFCMLIWVEHVRSHDSFIEKTEEEGFERRPTQEILLEDNEVVRGIDTTEGEEGQSLIALRSGSGGVNDNKSDLHSELAENKAWEKWQFTAAEILIQPPIEEFLHYAHGTCWLAGALLTLDLQFRLDVVITWTLLSILGFTATIRKMRQIKVQKTCNARGRLSTADFGHNNEACNEASFLSFYWDRFRAGVPNQWSDTSRDTQLNLLCRELRVPLVSNDATVATPMISVALEDQPPDER